MEASGPQRHPIVRRRGARRRKLGIARRGPPKSPATGGGWPNRLVTMCRQSLSTVRKKRSPHRAQRLRWAAHMLQIARQWIVHAILLRGAQEHPPAGGEAAPIRRPGSVEVVLVSGAARVRILVGDWRRLPPTAGVASCATPVPDYRCVQRAGRPRSESQAAQVRRPSVASGQGRTPQIAQPLIQPRGWRAAHREIQTPSLPPTPPYRSASGCSRCAISQLVIVPAEFAIASQALATRCCAGARRKRG